MCDCLFSSSSSSSSIRFHSESRETLTSYLTQLRLWKVWKKKKNTVHHHSRTDWEDNSPVFNGQLWPFIVSFIMPCVSRKKLFVSNLPSIMAAKWESTSYLFWTLSEPQCCELINNLIMSQSNCWALGCQSNHKREVI